MMQRLIPNRVLFVSVMMGLVLFVSNDARAQAPPPNVSVTFTIQDGIANNYRAVFESVTWQMNPGPPPVMQAVIGPPQIHNFTQQAVAMPGGPTPLVQYFVNTLTVSAPQGSVWILTFERQPAGGGAWTPFNSGIITF